MPDSLAGAQGNNQKQAQVFSYLYLHGIAFKSQFNTFLLPTD